MRAPGMRPMRAPAGLLVLLLGGCASAPSLPPVAPAEAAVTACLQRFRELDAEVAAYGSGPSYPAPVAGFPYLRVTRLLASYRHRALDRDQRAAWLTRLEAADRAVRLIERASLPAARQRSVSLAGLDRCYRRLRAYDLGHPARLAVLRARAGVPSAYLTAARVLGLYPLTALLLERGVRRYQAQTRQRFALPLNQLPVLGKLHRYQPPPAPPDNHAGAPWPVDALGIPSLGPDQLDRLYARYAPVWEIDTRGAYDRPGQPVWRGPGQPGVDPGLPLVYRYLSYTRWQGRVLPQLNYQIWFDRRPLSGAFDILGGVLDGLIWRVTLAGNGRPLIYDTIHPCGCYHLWLPTPALTLRPAARRLPEPPLVVQPAPRVPPGERLVLRLASATHYLERAYAAAPSGTVYEWRDYSELYRTPVVGSAARRNLFGPDGRVPGSERGERYLLWPSGVPEPGAMRERGHHAIAFVGRRQFTDPDLLQSLFRPREVP